MNDLDSQIKNLLSKSVALTPPGPVDVSNTRRSTWKQPRLVAAVASVAVVGIAGFGVLLASRSSAPESVSSEDNAAAGPQTDDGQPVGTTPTTEPQAPLTTNPVATTTLAPQATEPPGPTLPLQEVLPVAAFEGLIAAECLRDGSTEGPANAVPMSIDLSLVPSPVAETGIRTGPTDPGAEVFNPQSAEYWVPVGDETAAMTFGYVHVPLSEIEAAPESQDPNCHPELAIYDENAVLIGTFVDGAPVIASTR